MLSFRIAHRVRALPFRRPVALLTTIALPLISAQSQSRAAVTRRYRIDSKTEQSVDASAIGGGKQASVMDRSAFMRVTVGDSAGGKALRFVVDSIVHRGSDVSASTIATSDSARGKAYTAFMAPDGKVTLIVRADGAGALGLAIEGQLDEFFPRYSNGFKTGDQWTVNSDRAQRVPKGELMVKRTTSYAAMGELMRDGVKASRLDMTFTTSSKGKQSFGATPSTVEGRSMGSGSAFITSAGVYLGGMRTEKTDRRLLLSGAKAPVTIEAESMSTITLLK